MPFSILGVCLAPALPLLPFAIALAWARGIALLRPDLRSRVLLVLALLALTGIAVLRVSQGRTAANDAPVGLIEAAWVVTSHPLWFVIGLIGFVNLLVLPMIEDNQRPVLRWLYIAALALFGLMIAQFLVANPDDSVKSFADLTRFAPINVTVGAAFAVASAFLFNRRLKDRQISIVTLLMLAIFLGAVGSLAVIRAQ